MDGCGTLINYNCEVCQALEIIINNLLLIRRKYLYEYIQMRLTSYIKIIIK